MSARACHQGLTLRQPGRRQLAAQQLADVGLDGEDAASDIRELRGLLEAFNTAKHTAWQTVVKVITTGLPTSIRCGTRLRLRSA